MAGVLLAVMAAGRGQGPQNPQEFVRTYDASTQETFEALHSAVTQLRYRVISIDAKQNEIAFNTGMSMKTWAGQDFTAVVRGHEADRSELRLVGGTSTRGFGGQLYSWGETEQLGNRVLDRTSEELHQSSARRQRASA